MKYKYLLFDLDGTILDTTKGVFNSAKYALKHFGIDATLGELKPIFGPPLKYSFTTFFKLTEEQTDEAIRIYREHYIKYADNETRVFDGVPSLLVDLKNTGYNLAIATSKYEEHAITALKHYNLAHLFDYITGTNLDATITEKHEVIEESLRRFGISENRQCALMIGDTKYDIEGAKKAGIDSFGIYTGAAEALCHEKAGATYVAYSFSELRNKLISDFND